MIQNRSFQVLDLLRRAACGAVVGGIRWRPCPPSLQLLHHRLRALGPAGQGPDLYGSALGHGPSIAFCGIDFAGIARLFTPQVEASQEPWKSGTCSAPGRWPPR